jgi:phage shock protein A
MEAAAERAIARADRVAEQAIAQRDEMKRELAEVKAKFAALESERDQAEARAQIWESRGAALRQVVNDIVNDPHMDREHVQGRLLVAAQNYDGMKKRRTQW